MAGRSKAAYSERKHPKSTFILTVNCPVYPPIQGKENRLPQRPINSAIGTGGLDFLIACALLILCHSLFEVVILSGVERKDAGHDRGPARRGGAFAPCERFAAGKTSAQAEFTSAEH